MSFFRKNILLDYKCLLKKIEYNEQKINHKNLTYFKDTTLRQVIKKNILENEKWYTPHMMCHPEISQGRLESLFNYQTMIREITSLRYASCSVFDSRYVYTEALNIAYLYHEKNKNSFFIDKNLHPYIKKNLKKYGRIMDLDIIEDTMENIKISDNLFGAIFSYPNTNGNIFLYEDIVKDLNKNKKTTISYNDINSLMILKSPGEIGIDISIGEIQNFDIPFFNKCPYSSFIATKEEYGHLVPGKIVLETVDRNKEKCYTVTFQKRCKSIEEEKTCTSKYLLANISSMYSINRGKENLIKISEDIYLKTKTLKFFLNKTFELVDDDNFYNTLKILDKSLYDTLKINGYITKLHKNGISISLNEKINFDDCSDIINICNKISMLREFNMFLDDLIVEPVTKEIFEEKYKEFGKEDFYNLNLRRDKDFLNQSIFKNEKSEIEMLRYINYLSDKDYSIVNGVVPDKSCTNIKLESDNKETEDNLSFTYLKKELGFYYKTYIYNDLNGDKFIIDLSSFKEFGITDKDISKRLIDYSFHPPSNSYNIPNSLTIEKKRIEDIEELYRFSKSMISIYKEIEEIKENKYTKENNVLVNSPHSYSDLIDWNFDYTMEKAFFPLPNLRKNKKWPSNSRIE